MTSFASTLPVLTCAPYQLSGTVVGTLLNHRPLLELMGEAVHAAPYKAPPNRPILYIKPRNTFLADGGAVPWPDGAQGLEVGVSLGIVIGQVSRAVPVSRALATVAGYLVVADLCLPHTSVYRPNVRQRAQDGFCPMAPRMTPVDQVTHPDALEFTVSANGKPVQQSSTNDRVRSVAQLIADVSTFMTLMPGDVLMLGNSMGAPVLPEGTTVTVSMPPLAPLTFRLGSATSPNGGQA